MQTNNYRVIIAGTRGFSDYERLCQVCDRLLSNKHPNITIVSGMEPTGADALGVRYAKERGYGLDPHPANWAEFGNAAGPIRNREMAKVALACVVFWDGRSPGSASMIREAKKAGLALRVVRIARVQGRSQDTFEVVSEG